jgi:hypothetical protein
VTATAARALARSLVDGDRFAPRRGPWRRTVAIGDPQARADKIFAVLAAHDLLADDGRLRDDVQLVSIGDHFDFGTRAEGTIADAQVDGPAVLRWLCAHGPAQVIVLVGNHDLARVDELAGATDARFAAAAAWLAERAARPERDAPGAGDAARADYVASFPELPAPGMVHRDLSAFTEAQQQLVRRELSAGRLALGATADLPSGRPALLTHAAITGREVALLGCGLADPPAVLAAALDGWLGRAVAAVAPRWAAGQPARLDLAPLHLGGAIGADDPAVPEGGGLLYHRPADPSRPAAPAIVGGRARATAALPPRRAAGGAGAGRRPHRPPQVRPRAGSLVRPADARVAVRTPDTQRRARRRGPLPPGRPRRRRRGRGAVPDRSVAPPRARSARGRAVRAGAGLGSRPGRRPCLIGEADRPGRRAAVR